MIVLSKSTPEMARIFVANRTYKDLMRGYHGYEGYHVWHYGVKGYRFVGTIINSKLVRT